MPIPYADKLRDESTTQYLFRLLTTIIACAAEKGQDVRIPLQSLVENAEGKGFIKRWDSATKELVLQYAPDHTEAYFRATPVSESNDKQPPAPHPKSLSQVESIATHTTHASHSATLPAQATPDVRAAERVVHALLDDTTLASRERTQNERKELSRTLRAFEQPTNRR
jgi:hypothetical protein